MFSHLSAYAEGNFDLQMFLYEYESPSIILQVQLPTS